VDGNLADDPQQVFEARTVADAALPVIDIAGLRSPDRAAREQVGKQLHDACRDKGFFYIANHGTHADVIANAFAQSRAFFALPEEAKNAVAARGARANRGYDPLRGQVLEEGGPPDLKEGFYLGADLPETDPRVQAGRFGRGPNQWPAQLAEFKPVMEEYFTQLSELAALLMSGIALSLSLDESYFAGFCADPLAVTLLLHYPPQPPHPLPNQKGCGAHTDFGAITLLAQDGIGGLQVWDDTLGWLHATPLQDTLVVNLGDLIARWTNDRYHSTLHRVVNVSGVDRYSIPFFFSGNPDFPVRCISTCLEPGEEAAYAETTVEAHIGERLRKSYAK
jgi:isopenicillin N synthase-like dioxygenase